MSEFNLSEFIFGFPPKLLPEDVKEFIRRLKLEMHLTLSNGNIINKLAGDKLI